MSDKLFLDLHVIQTVPPSCVNRDDTGSPKTAYYGGVKRARVSSQSWKRAVRESFPKSEDSGIGCVRTLRVVEMTADRICQMDSSISRDDALAKATSVLGLKLKLKEPKKSKTDAAEPSKAAALTFISELQVKHLAELAISEEFSALDEKVKKAKVTEILKNNNGAEILLFGRMLADSPELNVDASCQVAHAISTHKVDNEYDYYTAVDDLASEDTSGAGMIGTVEFNSSTLYRYATVAVHDLHKGFSGNKDATSETVAEFVRAFVLSMPTGKQNTFANRTVPDSVLITLRRDQPVNLVGAFETPVKPSGNGYAAESAARLVAYEKEVCSSFVAAPEKTWQIGKGLEELGSSVSLDEAVSQIRSVLSSEL